MIGLHFPRTIARLKRMRRSKRVERHDQSRAVIEQIYLAGIRKTLAHAQSEMLHKLFAGTGKPGFANARLLAFANTQPAAVDLMFDLEAFDEMFTAEMREAAEEALELSGQGMLSELGIDRKYVTPHGIVHDFVIQRENKLSDVPQEIYDEVKRELEEGTLKGETESQLAARVRDVFGTIDAGRAQTIARTETASAYNTARLDAMKQAGFTHKEWLTAHDERVRLTHNLAEAEGPIPVDQTFNNGLMHPGDPDGPPGEVINCRCTLLSAETP